jgi:hypothetical protein
MQRGALFWAEGLANTSNDGLKNFYDSLSGHLTFPARKLRLPPSALNFLWKMIRADDESLLKV